MEFFMTSHQFIEIEETRPIIESTFIKYEHSNDDDLMVQLETEKASNYKLCRALEISNYNLKRANEHLHNVKKLNHKFEQDVEFYKIQVNNLKNINIKFIRTINNLQSYREYVAQLLAKRSRTTSRITRLIQTVKNMQNIIKNKNAIIAKRNRNYDMVLQQAARIIKDSYSI
jgi:hypothetical protein